MENKNRRYEIEGLRGYIVLIITIHLEVHTCQSSIFIQMLSVFYKMKVSDKLFSLISLNLRSQVRKSNYQWTKYLPHKIWIEGRHLSTREIWIRIRGHWEIPTTRAWRRVHGLKKENSKRLITIFVLISTTIVHLTKEFPCC